MKVNSSNTCRNPKVKEDIQVGQKLAKDMILFADKNSRTVSEDEFRKMLVKMEKLSSQDLIKFIRSFDKDESVIELICDEVGSNGRERETIVREERFGNYTHQIELIRYIDERKWACKKVLTALCNKANELGIDTTDFEKQFLEELEHQFDSLGFVNTKKLDKIMYALTQSIENRLNFTEEDVQTVKNTSVEEGQKQANNIIENRLEHAYAAFGERVGADGKMTDKYEVKIPILDENGNPTDEFETKIETYNGRMQEDGLAADFADQFSKLWNNRIYGNEHGNTAALIRKDLKETNKQLQELKDASSEGTKAYEAKYKEIFGIEYDYANIVAYQKAEETYINAAQYHQFEMMFRRELKTLLSPAPLRDETESISADPSTNIIITNVTATKEQVFDREFNNLAKYLGEDGVEKLNQEFEAKGVANRTIEEKFEVLKEIAKNISKEIHTMTVEAGDGKEFAEVQAMYDNSYKAAYGIENDIMKRVTDYNTSQAIGEGISKAAFTLGASMLISSTGIGLVGLAASTAGLTVGIELVDRGSSGRALNALREQGLGEYLETVGKDVDWEATLRQALNSSGAVLIGGGVAKGVRAVMAGKSSVAQFAAMLGADVATDVAWQFMTTKEVTWQGVVFTVLLSSIGNYTQIKKMNATDPSHLGQKMMEEDGIVIKKTDSCDFFSTDELCLTNENGMRKYISLDDYDGSVTKARREIAKAYYDYKQSGLDIVTYMKHNPTANPELPYLVSSSRTEAEIKKLFLTHPDVAQELLRVDADGDPIYSNYKKEDILTRLEKGDIEEAYFWLSSDFIPTSKLDSYANITEQLISKLDGPLTGEIKQAAAEIEDLAKQALTLRAEGKTGEANILGGKASKKANEVSSLVRFKNIEKTYPDIAQELLRVDAKGRPIYSDYRKEDILTRLEKGDIEKIYYSLSSDFVPSSELNSYAKITEQLSSKLDGPLADEIKQTAAEVEDLAKQALTLRAEGKIEDAAQIAVKASNMAKEVSSLTSRNTRLKNLEKTHQGIFEELVHNREAYHDSTVELILDGCESSPNTTLTISGAKAIGIKNKEIERIKAEIRSLEREARSYASELESANYSAEYWSDCYSFSSNSYDRLQANNALHTAEKARRQLKETTSKIKELSETLTVLEGVEPTSTLENVDNLLLKAKESSTSSVVNAEERVRQKQLAAAKEAESAEKAAGFSSSWYDGSTPTGNGYYNSKLGVWVKPWQQK